ncbi:MAG: phage tail tape measure protein [Bacteroidetes bacterium 4572_117]|nr:MAG: phage tail tape measure protein [Bacteroidetes bacterium 4572_117]
MSKKLTFILELFDKTTAPLRKMGAGFNKVNSSVKKTQNKINLLPKSIKGLENELDVLKRKQANAFTTQGIRHYQKEIDATEKKLRKLNKSKRGGGFKGGIKNFGSELSNQIPALGGSMSMLASPAGIAAGAVVGVGAVLTSATSKAMNFEQGMAKVNGTLQLSPDKIKDVRDDLISMGAKSSTDLEKIPDAFYKIVSATGGDLPTSMKIMKASLKGAEAGFTDINNVADATVNIVNSVGKANTDATEVMDVLFATLNKGKTEFPDIANYLPKLIPISNNLGTSFKETAGAFAFLTANGLKAEASTTALQNVFKSFGNETVRKNFNSLGVEIFDASGKMREITQISKELSSSLDGLTDEERVKKLESLGLDQEAALGMSIMAANADELKTTIDYVAKSGGELNRTLEKSSNPLTKIKKLSNMIQAGMTKLGYAILPVVNTVLEKILSWTGGISEDFSRAWDKSELLRDAVGALGSALWNTVTFMFKGMKLVGKIFTWLGGKIGITKGSIFGLLEGIDAFYVNTKMKITAIGSGFLAIFKLIKKAWDGIWSGDLTALKKLTLSNLKGAFDVAYGDSYKNSLAERFKEKTKKKENVAQTNLPKADWDAIKEITNRKVTDENKGSGTSKGISSVTSGGKQQKNITINLGKFQDAINIHSENLQEGVNEMQDVLEKALLRILNSANQLG